MKRSIICFSTLAVLVIIASVFEIVYSNSLARAIDEMVTEFQSADDQEKSQIAADFKSTFKKRESLNELFFSKTLIEGLGDCINDLIIYSEHGDEKNFERSCARISLYSDSIRCAGVF